MESGPKRQRRQLIGIGTGGAVPAERDNLRRHERERQAGRPQSGGDQFFGSNQVIQKHAGKEDETVLVAKQSAMQRAVAAADAGVRRSEFAAAA